MTNNQAILISLVLFVSVGIGLVWNSADSIETKPGPVIPDEKKEQTDEGGNRAGGILATYRKVSALVDYAHQIRGAIQVFAQELADIELMLPSEGLPPHPDPIVVEKEILRWEQGRVVLVFCNKNQWSVRERAAGLMLDGETVLMVFPPFADEFKKYNVTMVPRYIVLEDGNEIYRGVNPPPKEN